MKYQQTLRHMSVVALGAVFFSAICFIAAVSAQSGLALRGGSPQANYSRELLKRADVPNELGLDAQQKDALAKALRRSDRPIVVRPVVTYQEISRLSDEARKQLNEEIGREAAKQTEFTMNERQREVEVILRPDQRERLAELDLQWRGVLALGVKSLSERLGVSPEHQERITDILSDFEVKRINLISYPEAVRYQKRRVLLLEMEQKALSVLSDEEKARWLQATGKLFKFEE